MSTNSKNFSNSFSLTDEIADVVRERILKGEYEIGAVSYTHLTLPTTSRV